MEFKNNLADKVFPGLLSDGAFGQDVVITKHDIAPIGGYCETHWMSCTFKATVELQDKKNSATRLVAMFFIKAKT